MGKRAADTDGIILTDEPLPQVLPVKLNGRAYCGELDIRIDAQGTWHYNASPVERKEMVCLFASMLMKDDCGCHWLVTPHELGRIEVEDAPFIAVDLYVEGQGEEQMLSFCTNVDQLVTVTQDTPLVMHASPVTGHMTPYVINAQGIETKISRAVYYDLVERGALHTVKGKELFGLWSDGAFFPLGEINEGEIGGGKIHAYDA